MAWTVDSSKVIYIFEKTSQDIVDFIVLFIP